MWETQSELDPCHALNMWMHINIMWTCNVVFMAVKRPWSSFCHYFPPSSPLTPFHSVFSEADVQLQESGAPDPFSSCLFRHRDASSPKLARRTRQLRCGTFHSALYLKHPEAQGNNCRANLKTCQEPAEREWQNQVRRSVQWEWEQVFFKSIHPSKLTWQYSAICMSDTLYIWLFSKKVYSA